MSDVTQILKAMQGGDTTAAGKLLQAVYDELRRLAARKMANEPAGHTLQPTALVHEAWLRLADAGDQEFENSTHFYAAAAEAMRRILVEHARRKRSLRRGQDLEWSELDESSLIITAPPEEVLAVHEALDLLAHEDAQAAELVKLRYFAGFSMAEAARTMGLVPRAAERSWTYARAWLLRAMQDAGWTGSSGDRV